MITGGGGVWDTAKSIYTQLPEGQRPKIREKALEFIFPSGAKIKFQHMEREADKINIQGLQFTLIGMDEGCQFESSQIEYAMSRLRSASKYPSRMVISCNPQYDHLLCRMITAAGYLNEEGYPKPEMDGVTKYFITIDGDYHWGDSKEDLKNRFGEKVKPISFQFISATIHDNPKMLEQNEEYLSFLEGLPPIDKAQLLHGCWFARPSGDKYFKRDYLKIAEKVPLGSICCRAYDKAGVERSVSNKNPDFTASCKMWKDKDGFYYITGDHHQENYDDITKTGSRFCATAGIRDVIIRKQAQEDGTDCTIVFPVDPGQSGISEFNTSSKPLIELGFKVKRDPVANNKSKLTRFTPFASLSEQGYVYIVKSSFSIETYEAYMKELESFDGTRSTTTRKDDFVDATASAFNYLAASKTHVGLDMPTFSGSNNISSDNTSNGFSAVDNMVSERGSLESLLDTSVPMRDPYLA